VNRKRKKQSREPVDNFGKFVPNALIIFVITIFLYDIFFYTEHWPFSSHRMYSTLIGPTHVKNEVYMVTPEGEIPMDVNMHLKPIGRSRLTYLLKNTVRMRDKRAVDEVLASLAQIYERNRAEHDEEWPEMIGINVYRLQWELDPELRNLEYPRKTRMLGFQFQ